uniref:1-acylglycerol-3-phosphate O-acyltransferase n=1 Tax=Jatropha curcas TaxID=180498 RepID=A0A0M5I8Y4_JATCU|nr:1-acyl-sn-glycerol-3-phosphate acyl transferase 5 [Jatropha curcas]
MEVRGAVYSGNETVDRALTPLKLIRGIVCLVVLVVTAFMMLVYFGFLSAVILRLFSIHYSRKATSFFFGAWLALWPFLFEKINKTKVIFSGETVPAKERVLLIANHRTEVDWMYLWDLAWRKGCLGYIKYVLKSSLMKLPVFGWGFHILEFISVERRWEVDASNMHQMLSSFRDRQDPLWLAPFPEGTDFTEQKCIRSQRYAAENNLPVLKNVLVPKTKGFYACLEDLKGSLDAVYDLTIGYKPRCPTLLDNVFGVNPSEVHIHVRRIALDEIPHSEKEVAAWLMKTFQLKDQLLTNFYSQGHFPHQGAEGDLSTVKCFVNFVAVILLIGTCMFFTFFSSIWFKIYVSLVCCYLASATYFNVRPMPLLSFLKTVARF